MRLNRGLLSKACAVFLLLPIAVAAELEVQGDSGFVSVHQLRLVGTPKQVYRALTREIEHWWDAAHSYSGRAKNFRLDAVAGGCFCERLEKGGSIEHLRVLFAQPGKLLRLSGGLGPLQGRAVVGVMDFALTAVGDETVLSYRYSVSGPAFAGLAAMADPVDRVQLGQLQRLQRYLRQGRKPLN